MSFLHQYFVLQKYRQEIHDQLINLLIQNLPLTEGYLTSSVRTVIEKWKDTFPGYSIVIKVVQTSEGDTLDLSVDIHLVPLN